MVLFFSPCLGSLHSSQSPTVGEFTRQGVLPYMPVKILNQEGKIISEKEIGELCMKCGVAGGQPGHWDPWQTIREDHSDADSTTLMDPFDITVLKLRKIKLETTAREMAFSSYWNVF